MLKKRIQIYEDTFISSLYPSKNFSNNRELKIEEISKFDTSRVLIKIPIDFSSIDSVDKIISVNLYFYVNCVSVMCNEIEVLRNLQDFNCGTVSWTTKPSVLHTNIFKEVGYNSKNQYIKIDITTLVKEWYLNEYSNYGIQLVAIENNLGLSFCSSRTPNSPWLSLVLDEECGKVGATGPTGSMGPTGYTGPAGISSSTGATGSMGSTGPMGPIGLKGESGATGCTGPTGEVGERGATGSIGPTGLKGDTGDIGQIGPTGYTGPTGVTGPAGLSSNTGATGANGPTGYTGYTGAIGQIGSTGYTGYTGYSFTDGLYIEGATGEPDVGVVYEDKSPIDFNINQFDRQFGTSIIYSSPNSILITLPGVYLFIWNIIIQADNSQDGSVLLALEDTTDVNNKVVLAKSGIATGSTSASNSSGGSTIYEFTSGNRRVQLINESGHTVLVNLVDGNSNLNFSISMTVVRLR